MMLMLLELQASLAIFGTLIPLLVLAMMLELWKKLQLNQISHKRNKQMKCHSFWMHDYFLEMNAISNPIFHMDQPGKKLHKSLDWRLKPHFKVTKDIRTVNAPFKHLKLYSDVQKCTPNSSCPLPPHRSDVHFEFGTSQIQNVTYVDSLHGLKLVDVKCREMVYINNIPSD